MKLNFCALVFPERPVCVLNFRLHLLDLVIVQRKPGTAKTAKEIPQMRISDGYGIHLSHKITTLYECSIAALY